MWWRLAFKGLQMGRPRSVAMPVVASQAGGGLKHLKKIWAKRFRSIYIGIYIIG